MASLIAEVDFTSGFGAGGGAWGSGFQPSGFGANGLNAWSSHLDKDKLTVWAWEYFGSGFARINLADGSPVFVGNTFGAVEQYNDFDNFGDSSVAWAQSDDGHYFSVAGSNRPFPDNTPPRFYKFHVGSGGGGDYGDGYFATDSFIDISAFEGADDGLEGGLCWGRSGGVGYCTGMAVKNPGPSFNGVFAINTDTMAVVGTYQPGTGSLFACPFMDKNGDFWWLNGDFGGGDYGIKLIQWHPPDGASGGTLNVTTHYVSAATLSIFGTKPPIFARYVPSIHAVLLGGNSPTAGPSFTAGMVTLDLTAFTLVASKTDDGLFFMNGSDLDGCESAFGCMQSDDGTIAIPAPYQSGGGNRPSGGYAGVVNFIDPATLAVARQLDVTSLINASGATTTPGNNGSFVDQEFASLQFVGASSGALSNPVVRIGHGLNQLSTYPPITPGGGGAAGKLVVTYAFEGSPAYLIQL